ncbi:hypothetical protein [Hymenobacter cheonanensis]|uniref:hypothetical protein n=1 Tax=Hymenobacter sp. CA2-7 TaxID=3063993 RepID=UPI0027132589|nr:hypothetical protein [Hymenobacter sp. CA2-7]MDO7885355.1 hypothetical protein [Hymenobacter sp. CA2-7]
MEDNILQRLAFYFVMAFLAAMLIDCTGGKSVVREAVVIDQVYVPAHTSWTTDSKGKLSPVYTADDYTIVVRGDDGVIVKVDTDTEGYYSAKPGKHISYRARWGWLSHHDWFPSF